MKTTHAPLSRGVWLAGLLAFLTPALQAQNVAWIQSPGSIRADVLEDVVVDDAGFSHVTGKFADVLNIGDTTLYSAGLADIFTAKFDPDGNLVWAHRDGSASEEVGVEIGIDAAGNVYVAGRFQDSTELGGVKHFSKGNVDIFIVKYDANGNFVWSEEVGGTRDDRCRGLWVDSVGHCYITGRFRNVALFDTFELTAIGLEDVFVAKLDLDGSVMWVNTFGGPKLDFGEAITGDKDGNLYVTGSYFQGVVFPDTIYVATGDEGTFLAKYDNDGNYLWSRSFGGVERDYGEDVNCDEFGNVLMAGTFSGEAYYGNDTVQGVGDLDILLVKVDPDGEVLWTFNAGAPGTANDVAWGSAYDGRGNAFLTGWFRGTITWGDTVVPGTSGYNIFVGKVDAGGNPGWFNKLGAFGSEDIGRGIACDALGNAYVAGGYEGGSIYGGFDTLTALGQYDMLLAKLNAGEDRCAFSHATYGVPTECSPVDGTYEIAVTLDHYFAPDSGDLVVNGQAFPIAGNRQTVLLTGLTPTGGPETLTAFFSADSACAFEERGAWTSPIPCDPCVIDTIYVDSIKACKFLTNRYEARLVIEYAFAPDSGALVVNGDTFAITGSPQFVDLERLFSNGEPVDVNAHFTAEPYCDYAAPALFTAPDTCNSCSIGGYLVNSLSACDPLTGTYSASLFFNIQAWPSSGGLVVNGQTFAITGSPLAVTLTGLPADGLPADLLAFFEGDSACQFVTASAWNAPPSCDTCVIGAVAFAGFGACSPLDDTYEASIEVTYASPPFGDSLDVNGQRFALTGSPQIVTLTGLAANGLPVDVTARFPTDSACSATVAGLFTAPDSCTDCAITGAVLDSVVNDCDPFVNTFGIELTVSYFNAPSSGDLLVNGTPFPIAGSPQAIFLDGLPANGAPTDVTIAFSEEAACTLALPAWFTAPEACDTCPVPVNLRHTLDSANITSVLVEWDAVPDATAYQVRGRKAASMATGVVFAFTNGKVVNNLQAGRTYAWTVRAYCPYDTSEFGPEAFFTLLSPRLAEAAGIGERVRLMPNPATERSWLEYEALASGELDLRITDLSGRVRLARQVAVFEGPNRLPLTVADLPEGLYLVTLRQGDAQGQVRLSIQRP